MTSPKLPPLPCHAPTHLAPQSGAVGWIQSECAVELLHSLFEVTSLVFVRQRRVSPRGWAVRVQNGERLGNGKVHSRQCIVQRHATPEHFLRLHGTYHCAIGTNRIHTQLAHSTQCCLSCVCVCVCVLSVCLVCCLLYTSPSPRDRG